MKPPTKYCAIYTRKSSEEGLEQDFNSLDAQRDACAAYITSQKAEGWKALATTYDDGGFSGGTMKRPALEVLIQAIQAGKVHIVVVYKIDRLTRSLMDFSKLVEIFDQNGVTFVSVTQSFNTTTSMGRLTLNVLLSFAQFERDITGERIRDKIAASKKKGLWMGGTPPLGYACTDKKLCPHPEEQELVRVIFTQYLTLGAVKPLKAYLDQHHYRTPPRVSQTGNIYGNAAFSRGHLYRILANPVYIGRIRHKGTLYESYHPAIIPLPLFEAVQEKLADNRVHRPSSRGNSASLLLGKLFDEEGTPYSPTHTRKGNKRYTYYISQNLIQYTDHPLGIMARLPAFALEDTITTAIKAWLAKPSAWASLYNDNPDTGQWLQRHPLMLAEEMVAMIVQKVIVGYKVLTLQLDAPTLQQEIKQHTRMTISPTEVTTMTLTIPFTIQRRRHGAIHMENPSLASKDSLDDDADRLRRIVKGIVWRDEHFAGATLKSIALRTGHGEKYIHRCIEESFNLIDAPPVSDSALL